MAQKEAENLKIQFEGWLKVPNIRAVQQALTQTKLQGTCDWIWSNPTFVVWNNATGPNVRDRLLCIHGTHGCGKTILASSVIDNLNRDNTQTIFFSFSGTDSGRQSFESLVRSLLWQLFQVTTDKKSLDCVRALMLKGQPLVSELWNTVKSIAESVMEPVYCIIDGLDECSDTIQIFLDHILELLLIKANFKSIVVGRSHALQTVVAATNRTIEIIPDLIKADIDAFIDVEIGVHDILKTEDLRDTIVQTLQAKSEGMFLWVKLMIDDLRKSDTPGQVKQRLRDLPSGLERAYRLLFFRLLEQLDKYELVLARNILTFIIAAFRPMDVEEIRYAHALNSGNSSCTFKDRLLIQPHKRILDVCSGLVNISNGIARPVHLSLKEFLTRPEEEWLRCGESEIMIFRVDPEGSNQSFSFICMDYLQMCDYGSPLHDAGAHLNPMNRYPFLKYSSRYLHLHLSRSGESSQQLFKQLGAFFASEKCTSWMEHLSLLFLDDELFTILLSEVEAFED